MDFHFRKALRDKPSTGKLLELSKICLETLIRDSAKYKIRGFLKDAGKCSFALALVADGKYPDFCAPKADYKLLIMMAEEFSGEWRIHQFICDLDSKNMREIENKNREPVEPHDLGLSTQAEIIFYERGHSHIASNRVARLEINKKRKFTSEKNILDIYNCVSKANANYHVAVIS